MENKFVKSSPSADEFNESMLFLRVILILSSKSSSSKYILTNCSEVIEVFSYFTLVVIFIFKLDTMGT